MGEREEGKEIGEEKESVGERERGTRRRRE